MSRSPEGPVERWSQREDAERAVRNLTGVKMVVNKITVTPAKPVLGDVCKAIEQALERRAEREARRIQVDVRDGTVTLTGRFIRGRSANRCSRPPASLLVSAPSRTICAWSQSELAAGEVNTAMKIHIEGNVCRRIPRGQPRRARALSRLPVYPVAAHCPPPQRLSRPEQQRGNRSGWSWAKGKPTHKLAVT